MSGPGVYRRVRRAAGRNSPTWRTKKILMSLLVVGALSSLTAASTYALMNTESTNVLNTASSGTLTLSNTVNSGSACFSYGAGSTGNTNPGCDALFTSATLNYPGTPVTAKVKIKDDGSLDVGTLSIAMSPCAVAATPGAPAPGGGNPCDAAGDNFALQETDSSWNPTFCWYPDYSAGACTVSAGTLNYFSTNAPPANPYNLSLGYPSGPVHAATRYFQVIVQLPTGASNTLQGEAAVFTLNWHIET